MKAKIVLSLIQFFGLLLLLILLAIGLLIVFVNDAISWNTGYISIAAFLVAAYVFGTVLNKVVDNIGKLWD